MDLQEEKRAWREVGHKQRFLNAFRGVYVFWMTSNNLFKYISVFAILFVIALGFYFKITSFEWVSILFAIGLVVVSEAFNTALEIDIDLTSPEFHPYARDTKDVAAGAVVLAVFFSGAIGLMVFLPYLIAKFF